MRRISVLLPCLVLLTTSVARAGPLKIAVLELHDFAGLSRQEVGYITDLVRRQALSLPQESYFVMTRENILEMLPPGTDMAACEGECEVEAGRKVGADFVLSGEVIRFGSQLKVSLKMHDTKSSRLLASDAATASAVEGLEGPVAAAAGRMFGHLPSAGAGGAGGRVTVSEAGLSAEGELEREIVNPEVDESGFLFVESEPSGATVTLNGEEKGVTPYQAELMLGSYFVTCSKGGLYKPARRLPGLPLPEVNYSMFFYPFTLYGRQPFMACGAAMSGVAEAKPAVRQRT